MTAFADTTAAPSPHPSSSDLPSMYDLPSENPEEPGLPDEFHDWQPQLLTQTFVPATYPPELVFTASDLNLYYDVLNTGYYKRPDWLAVVGVPRLVDAGRLSYVLWREGRAPTVVVELLSPGTLEEDQGQTSRGRTPPSKWEVYESILRVPYYVLYNREGNVFRVFRLEGATYREQDEPRLWIPELEIGLGLWEGRFAGVQRQWLRWYDSEGRWILFTEEKLEIEQRAREHERLAREQAESRAEALRERLRAAGIDPDSL